MLKVFIKRFFILSLFFSSGAFAQTVYYYYGGFTDSPKFGDPQSACDAYFDRVPLAGSTKSPYLKRPTEVYYRCQVQPGDRQHGFVEERSCPGDHFFNSETGECEPEEPQECEAGNEALRISYAFSGNSPNPPSSICTSGCVHVYKGTLGVGMSEPTVPGLFKYWAKYESTETACEGETPQEDPPPAPDPDPSEPGDGSGPGDPDPQTPNHCPPGYSPGPNSDTCFKNPDPDGGGSGPGDGGGSGPGDGGGSGPGDGGGSGPGDGGGSGPGDGGGSGPGDGGGSGPGDGGGSGPGDGGGSGPGGGGGTGPGDGDGDGEEEGEGEYKPGQGDSVCESKPECSGDPIQCGIVDQQWRSRCDAEKAGDFPGQKDAIGEAITGPQFGLLEAEGDIEVPSFIEGHTRWLPAATCPPDERMALQLAGGRTFSLSYQPLCTAATTISPLLVVIATVLAGLYIGRASGD